MIDYISKFPQEIKSGDHFKYANKDADGERENLHI